MEIADQDYIVVGWKRNVKKIFLQRGHGVDFTFEYVYYQSLQTSQEEYTVLS